MCIMINTFKENKLKPLGICLRFSQMLLKSTCRDLKTIALLVSLPLFMLTTFWLTTGDGSEASQEIREHMMPAIVAMAAMIPAQLHATTIVRWRENKLTQRISMSPLGLAKVIFCVSLVRIILGVVMGIIFVIPCLSIMQQSLTLSAFLCSMQSMLLISICFVGLGSMLAMVFNNSLITGYAFFGLFIPLFFLGSFPDHMLPQAMCYIIPFLPTTMGIRLLTGFMNNVQSSMETIFQVLGLLFFTLIFFMLTFLFFYIRKKSRGGK